LADTDYQPIIGAPLNIIGHFDGVSLHQATLILKWMTVCGYSVLLFKLSLAIHLWVLAVVTATTWKEVPSFT